MGDVQLNMIIRPYDQICPLLLNLVETPGVHLNFDFHTPLTVGFPDGVDAAEVSFNRYTRAWARGDHGLVGLPAFILRGFRHRNFFVRQDSELESLSQLQQLRIGTNAWGDTGTLWARAALREAGVEVEDSAWVVGALDNDTPTKPRQPGDSPPPDYVHLLDAGDTLMAALQEGRIDAVTTAFAPEAVFQPNGPVRRLVRNYPQVEADYYRRCGVYPGFHILAFRREFTEQHPEIVVTLYTALMESWRIWTAKAKKFAEASPWQMSELEKIFSDFRDDALPFGMASKAHQRMVAAICNEQKAQGLVSVAANPSDLFADFHRIASGVGMSASLQ